MRNSLVLTLFALSLVVVARATFPGNYRPRRPHRHPVQHAAPFYPGLRHDQQKLTSKELLMAAIKHIVQAGRLKEKEVIASVFHSHGLTRPKPILPPKLPADIVDGVIAHGNQPHKPAKPVPQEPNFLVVPEPEVFPSPIEVPGHIIYKPPKHDIEVVPSPIEIPTQIITTPDHGIEVVPPQIDGIEQGNGIEVIPQPRPEVELQTAELLPPKEIVVVPPPVGVDEPVYPEIIVEPVGPIGPISPIPGEVDIIEVPEPGHPEIVEPTVAVPNPLEHLVDIMKPSKPAKSPSAQLLELIAQLGTSLGQLVGVIDQAVEKGTFSDEMVSEVDNIIPGAMVDVHEIATMLGQKEGGNKMN